MNASHEGTTPLHLAAEQGAAPLVALLLARGADVNGLSSQDTTNREGGGRMTPLMLAAERGNVAAVKLLLAHGADTAAFVPGTYATNVTMLAEMLHHGEAAALIRQQSPRK